MVAKPPHPDVVVDNVTSEEFSKTATQHYATIGQIAASWAGFEWFIDVYALALGRIPVEAGLCLTSQISGSARKLDAYIAIACLRGADEKLVGELNKFAQNTKALAERRNRVVHDPWMVATGKGVSHRLETTARKKLRYGYVAVPNSEMLKLFLDITNHNMQFLELHEQIKAAVDRRETICGRHPPRKIMQPVLIRSLASICPTFECARA